MSGYEDALGDDPWPTPGSGSAAAPATSARALADILREAGISSAGAGGRRRRRTDTDSPSDDDAATDVPAVDARFDEPVTYDTQTDFGSLGSYLLGTHTAAPETGFPLTAAPLGMATAPPGIAAALPGIAAAAGTAMPPDTGQGRVPPPRTDTGPVPTHGWSGRTSGRAQSSGSSSGASAIAATRDGEAPSAAAAGAAGSGGPSAPAHANRSPSPLAPAPADDPAEGDSAVAPHSGAISWAILVVEMLAAAGLGIAAWYAFSALWELLPYAAALVGPLVVTGLVAVAGALRARTGRNPLSLPTLCILVFAGTVLVVLPAATLIVP